jgi:hypothetical protein
MSLVLTSRQLRQRRNACKICTLWILASSILGAFACCRFADEGTAPYMHGMDTTASTKPINIIRIDRLYYFFVFTIFQREAEYSTLMSDR